MSFYVTTKENTIKKSVAVALFRLQLMLTSTVTSHINGFTHRIVIPFNITFLTFNNDR